MRSRLRRLCCLACVALTGCYTYAYLPVTPTPGTRLVLDLNDRGRADLGNNIGPEVASVEGTLVTVADSQYVMRVDRTIGLRGQSNPWNGESANIPFLDVGVVRLRKFSPGRTAVLAGVATAGFVAFVASRGLLGTGSGTQVGPPPPPPGQN